MADWAVTHKLWEKWIANNLGTSGEPLKAALLINYDPAAPSRLTSCIKEGILEGSGVREGGGGGWIVVGWLSAKRREEEGWVVCGSLEREGWWAGGGRGTGWWPAIERDFMGNGRQFGGERRMMAGGEGKEMGNRDPGCFLAEQEGTNFKPVELRSFLNFIKQNNLQTEFFFIGSSQYLVTSIHEHWFCARCINTSRPAGEGVIVMQIAAYLLVAMYEGSIGSATRAMVAVEQFVWQLSRRIH
ncbi:hypothetical protein IEQ34_002695 [Dendrobium chrysotoxum]|uniref:Profilin n=1 Tax=Dendrobium chrysotoxum TaxID=161865 RepID=A0AAV7HH93_DENCH|nr:hypothetical protein IEQ34_002695 [Dendrobium chrysotoxum]